MVFPRVQENPQGFPGTGFPFLKERLDGPEGTFAALPLFAGNASLFP
jgi:hypothetical protein